MTQEDQNRLMLEIKAMEEEKAELERALPPHSVKPAQLLRIEALEEAIESKKDALSHMR